MVQMRKVERRVEQDNSVYEVVALFLVKLDGRVIRSEPPTHEAREHVLRCLVFCLIGEVEREEEDAKSVRSEKPNLSMYAYRIPSSSFWTKGRPLRCGQVDDSRVICADSRLLHESLDCLIGVDLKLSLMKELSVGLRLTSPNVTVALNSAARLGAEQRLRLMIFFTTKCLSINRPLSLDPTDLASSIKSLKKNQTRFFATSLLTTWSMGLTSSSLRGGCPTPLHAPWPSRRCSRPSAPGRAGGSYPRAEGFRQS